MKYKAEPEEDVEDDTEEFQVKDTEESFGVTDIFILLNIAKFKQSLLMFNVTIVLMLGVLVS